MSYRLLFVCALNGVFTCAPAFSQSSADTTEQIDTIIVTASRSPLAAASLGSSTTVITRGEIELRQARYVTDLLRSVPGFAVSQAGTSGSLTQVRVRGAEANHVLVLIDGVRANDPASGDEFRWELLSTSNIERIEIVRGPQSSLWGSDAVAAVVHVITRSAGNGPDLNAYAEGGSHDTRNAGVSGAVGGERWSLGFGVERLQTDGTNIARAGTEDDGSEMTTGSLSSRVNPSANLELTLSLRAVDAWSQFDPVDFFVTGLPADGDVATDSARIYANAGATLRSFDGRYVHQLHARFLDTDNRNVTAGVADSATAADRRTISYQSDIQIGHDLLSLAIEHERSAFEQRGEIGFGDPNQDQEMSVLSVIADYQGNSPDRLTWLLSARYDDNSDFRSAWSGRLSVAWAASDSTLFRGNIGTGHKAPTFIERFGFFPAQFVGNPDLKPEQSLSVDLGIDRKFSNAELELQLTGFYQDLRDEINGFVFDPNTFLFTAQNSNGDSTRKGVELAATFAMSEALRFGATYTYTDASESDVAGQQVRELRRPRHSGSLYGDLRLLEGRANLKVIADYGGEATDLFFPPFPSPSEFVTLGAYWLLDATASFDVNANTSIYLRGSNLLDEEYEQVFGYRAPGRSVYAGIRLGLAR